MSNLHLSQISTNGDGNSVAAFASEANELFDAGFYEGLNEHRSHIAEKIKSHRILIVDDEKTNVLIVKKHLSNAGYTNFITSTDARIAYPLIKEHSPDLILLDIHMPHLSGIEILQLLDEDYQLSKIPVVVLTASDDRQVKLDALELGVSDFLNKPVDPADLLPRVRNALTIKHHFDQLANQRNILKKAVEARTEELYLSRQQVILSLARAAEHRDNDTGNHVLRVGHFSAIIAEELGWEESQVDMIRQAAQLHDVGKIGIPDEVLFKPGKLDKDEYDLMKSHCSIGTKIISPFTHEEANQFRRHVELGANILRMKDSPLMTMACRIAQTHHEHWDGKGYPIGLAGEDIPIEGRIVAIADVFDALSSKRPYKDPFPREKCFQILREGRGTHFDPTLLDVFFSCTEKIVEIQIQLMD